MSKIDFQKLDIMDALDLAVLIEEEAEERYAQFVQQLGSRYTGDAGDVFSAMVKNEVQHKNQLLERRKKLFGNAKVRVNRDMIWDVEAPSQNAHRAFMSAYEAMEVALQGEIKAYEFFVQALKVVKDEKVRGLFSELRDEELQHQNLLKKWMDSHKGDKGPDRSSDPSDGDSDEPPGL